MPTVWVRGDPFRRTRFHRTPECTQLTKRPSRGEHHPLQQVELSEAGVRPCLTCYPDAPRILIRKVYCPLCDSKRACAHNGGTPVTLRDGRRFWLWPDTNQMPRYRRSA